MVVLEKCGSFLAVLHNARGLESKCFVLSAFGIANTPLVTCLPVPSKVKITNFYLIFIIFLLFLYYFCLIFIISVFCHGFGGFRVVPARFRQVPVRFRVVPAGSGRFRQVPAGSGRFR